MKIFSILFLALSLHLHALELKESSGELKEPAKKLLELFDFPTDLPPQQLSLFLETRWLKEDKERWEMTLAFEEKKQQALPILKELNCIESIYPKETFYDYALVFGSIGKTMQRRLDFLYTQWKQGIRIQQVILLSGDRKLDPDRELIPQGCKTEADLFAFLFKEHPLSKLVPSCLVKALKRTLPDGTLSRPNTETTIKEWFASHPTPGKCLCVSTQPFVGYQEAVAKAFAPKTFSFEGIGPGTQTYPTADLDLLT